MSNATKEHSDRIMKELSEAGMTTYGFMKYETSHLPEVIHKSETIHGVIYGRLESILHSAMLVASDKRILFLDCGAFYKTVDEIPYDAIIGVKLTLVSPFASVVLRTRVRNFSIRFVNINCANIFTKYIESHLESNIYVSSNKNNLTSTTGTSIQKKVTKENEPINKNIVMDTSTAVLSTVDLSGNPHSSVIHYITDKDENFYFLTKSNTNKVKYIMKNSNVALNIHRDGSLKSLLVKGSAEVVTDSGTADLVYSLISPQKKYIEGKKLPPVTKMKGGNYIVYRLKPKYNVLQDFSIFSW